MFIVVKHAQWNITISSDALPDPSISYRHAGHLQLQNEVRKRRALSAQMAQATDSALVAEENHTWQSAKGLYVYCKRMNFHSEHTIDE